MAGLSNLQLCGLIALSLSVIYDSHHQNSFNMKNRKGMNKEECGNNNNLLFKLSNFCSIWTNFLMEPKEIADSHRRNVEDFLILGSRAKDNL